MVRMVLFPCRPSTEAVVLTFISILTCEVRIGLQWVCASTRCAKEDEQSSRVEHRPWAEPAEGAALSGRKGSAGRGHQCQYIDMGLLGPEQGWLSRVVQNFCKLMTQCPISVNMLFTSARMSKSECRCSSGYTCNKNGTFKARSHTRDYFREKLESAGKKCSFISFMSGNGTVC